MSGNVWEWCDDDVINLPGMIDLADQRVVVAQRPRLIIRGGSFTCYAFGQFAPSVDQRTRMLAEAGVITSIEAREASSISMISIDPSGERDFRYTDAGFRCVLEEVASPRKAADKSRDAFATALIGR